VNNVKIILTLDNGNIVQNIDWYRN
jgi:hypothetical protein